MKLRNNVKQYCCIRKRAKVNSIKEEDLKSTVYATKIKAEMSLCSFRFIAKCKVGKESIQKRLKKIDNEVSSLVIKITTKHSYGSV